MYREGYKSTTQGNTLRYLKRVTVDLDTCEEYEISDFLLVLDKKKVPTGNFIKAINRYLKFRGVDYRFKKKPIKGDQDIWIPTEEEAAKIRKATWDSPYTTMRNRLILDILFITGVRRSEVRDLKFSDARKTPDKEIQGVYHYYLHVIGKNDKRRFVDIPKFLYDDIMHFKMLYGCCDFIFDNGHGVPIHPQKIGKICREAGKKARVKGFHTHAARHYRAVELDEQGIDIESIRRFLGHENLATTQLYLRGRRNKTRKELILKDKYFEGVREELECHKPKLRKT